MIGEILQALDALGHWRVGTEQTGNAPGGQRIDDIHLGLGWIHVHRKPMIAIFEFKQGIG